MRSIYLLEKSLQHPTPDRVTRPCPTPILGIKDFLPALIIVNYTKCVSIRAIRVGAPVSRESEVSKIVQCIRCNERYGRIRGANIRKVCSN